MCRKRVCCFPSSAQIARFLIGRSEEKKIFRGHCACVEELSAWLAVARCPNNSFNHDDLVQVQDVDALASYWILQLSFEQLSTGSQSAPLLRHDFVGFPRSSVRAAVFLHAPTMVRVLSPLLHLRNYDVVPSGNDALRFDDLGLLD